MRVHACFLLCAVGICGSLLARVEETECARLLCDSLSDTSGVKTPRRHLPVKSDTFKLLPKFYQGKDTAGFKLLPKHRDGSDFVPYEKEPQIVKQVEPRYPEQAIRAGLEGRVVVKMWVDKKGKVGRVVIVKSDAEIFNKPAIEAAKQFVFTPAYLGGKPIGVWVSYPFRFRLPGKKPDNMERK